MKRVFFLSVAGAAILIGLLVWESHRESKPTLFIYCGAGIKSPVEEIAKNYEGLHGVRITLQYGPSNTLVTQAEVSSEGDLLLPGDESFIQMAREKGLIEDAVPLATMSPALVVAKGNPKNIRSVLDLFREDVRLAQALPDGAAAGRLVRDAFTKSGQWEQLKKRTAVFKATVNDVAVDVKVGAADAAFIWDAMLVQYPELELVPLPELASTRSLVSIGLLRSSVKPALARDFMDYAAANEGGRVFRENGFTPAR